jgi:hypothetical protein
VQKSTQARKELYQNLLWEHRELSTSQKMLAAAFDKAKGEF